MAKKSGVTRKPKGNEVPAAAKPDEKPSAAIARAVLRPTVQAALTLKEYGKAFGDLDLPGLIEELRAQTEAASAGDLGRGEAMLATQAHILDAIFNNLAQSAIRAEFMDNLDRYLKLALRAQSQCRATWEALAAIKNPPTMGYVKQANIAHGHQQVNNAASGTATDDASPARETPDVQNKLLEKSDDHVQNKLLEKSDDQRLDIRAEGAAGRVDPALAPLGKVDRPENA